MKMKALFLGLLLVSITSVSAQAVCTRNVGSVQILEPNKSEKMVPYALHVVRGKNTYVNAGFYNYAWFKAQVTNNDSSECSGSRFLMPGTSFSFTPGGCNFMQGDCLSALNLNPGQTATIYIQRTLETEMNPGETWVKGASICHLDSSYNPTQCSNYEWMTLTAAPGPAALTVNGNSFHYAEGTVSKASKILPVQASVQATDSKISLTISVAPINSSGGLADDPKVIANCGSASSCSADINVGKYAVGSKIALIVEAVTQDASTGRYHGNRYFHRYTIGQ